MDANKTLNEIFAEIKSLTEEKRKDTKLLVSRVREILSAVASNAKTCSFSFSTDLAGYPTLFVAGGWKTTEFLKVKSNGNVTYCKDYSFEGLEEILIACDPEKTSKKYLRDPETKIVLEIRNDRIAIENLTQINQKGQDIFSPWIEHILGRSLDCEYLILSGSEKEFSPDEIYQIYDRAKPDLLCRHLDTISREDWILVAEHLSEIIDKMRSESQRKAKTTKEALTKVENMKV